MFQFPFFRKRSIFSKEEQHAIVNAIQQAELQTSAEVRLYVESHCKPVNTLDRAAELFQQLKMQETKQKNAVLVYIAVKDRKYAVYADHGIHQELGSNFWDAEVKNMSRHFKALPPANALVEVIAEVGNALKNKFPFDSKNDTNELSNEIVFGK